MEPQAVFQLFLKKLRHHAEYHLGAAEYEEFERLFRESEEELRNEQASRTVTPPPLTRALHLESTD
jgi:hypothetical protein